MQQTLGSAAYLTKGTTSFLEYLDVYFFATWKDTLYNILDDVAKILEEANTQRVSASEKRVLVTKAVADADVCVTGVDGAGAAPSDVVSHASSSVSNGKMQTTFTTFFK